MNTTPIAFQGEMMLAGWSDGHSAGPKIAFYLAEKRDLDVFRDMTVKKGNMAGQRFMAVLVEIGPDEKPVALGLSQRAAMMCKSMGFWQFVETKAGYAREGEQAREEHATQFLRAFCGIDSRSELDTNGRAASMYQILLSEYAAFNSTTMGSAP
jgi:hypothetical protein